MLSNRYAAIALTALVCTALTAVVMNHRVQADPAPIVGNTARLPMPPMPVPLAPVIPAPMPVGQPVPMMTQSVEPQFVPVSQAIEAPAAFATAPNEAPAARRRESTVKMPSGAFAKEFDVAPYGSGRIVWNYVGDKVYGTVGIDVSAFGVEVELSTEAEISMSSHGTIYGVITSVRLTNLKVNPALLGEMPIRVGPDLYSFIEPLVNEFVVDMPFSYQCRTNGDRLTISNYRVFCSGPNPLSKLGFLGMGGSEMGMLAYFQLPSMAVEGTYSPYEPQQAAPKPRQRDNRPMPVPMGTGRLGKTKTTAVQTISDSPNPQQNDPRVPVTQPFQPFVVNQYAADPAVRMNQLLQQSEDLRQNSAPQRPVFANVPPAMPATIPPPMPASLPPAAPSSRPMPPTLPEADSAPRPIR